MSLRDVLNKSKKEKKKAQAIDTAKKVGVGLGVGAAVGAAAGVLLAPKAGEETRKDIADAAKNAAQSVKEGAGEVGEKISKIVEEGKEKIANLKKDKEAGEEVAAGGDKCCDDHESCCGGCAEAEEPKMGSCCED